MYGEGTECSSGWSRTAWAAVCRQPVSEISAACTEEFTSGRFLLLPLTRLGIEFFRFLAPRGWFGIATPIERRSCELFATPLASIDFRRLRLKIFVSDGLGI